MSNNADQTSDMRLSEAVEQALLADATTSDHPVSVAAEGGMITLSGRVPDQAVKDAAIRVARSVAGVADVIDDVTVGRDERPGLFGLGDADARDADTGDTTTDRAAGLPLAGAAAAGLGWAGGSGGTGQGSGAAVAGPAIVATDGLADDDGATTTSARGDDNTAMDDWEG